MKRSLFYAFACALLLQGCSKDKDLYTNSGQENNNNDAIKENVTKVFGVTFDANQDWSMLKNGEVTITANADLDDIAIVQILTASPFGNNDAKILNEATVTKGETLKLNYDAPSDLTRLYAACVSKDGRYRIKGFEIGQTAISFTNSANARTTRAVTRAYAVPTATPKINQIINTINADRAASTDEAYQLWQNSGWKDKLVRQDDGNEQAQLQNIADLTEDEKTDLRDIIFTYLPQKGDNIGKIRASTIFNTESNYLTSTGEPISFAYVHCGTLQSHIGSVHLYYYYYKPEQLEGKTEAEKIQFLKDLPKYKASQAWRTYSGESGYEDLTKRKHLLFLPYYGDEEPTIGKTGEWDFPAGYKIGFIMRRANSDTEWTKNNTGCLYSDGRLNQEINQYGFYGQAGLAPTDPRTAIFGANGKNYMCFEDGNDRDFNDLIIEFESGVSVLDEQLNLDKNVYTYAFEDRNLGDYDLNDVVVKAQRIDQTHVKYSVEACGANDALFLRNINGSKLNGNTEIHALFNVPESKFVNTEANATQLTPVQEIVTVPASFSFAKTENQIYIYNKTTNSNIHVATLGEDPHAILIPYDFKYPLERVCVKDAYLQFNNWGQDRIDSTDWYKYAEDGKVYLKSVFK